MASGVGLSPEQRNALEIRKLNERHKQRRKDIIQKNESQISDLRKAYSDRKAAIRKQGDAAVNHIQKMADRTSKQMDTKLSEQVDYKQRIHKQRLEQLKASHEQESRDLKRSISSSEAALNDRLNEVRAQKTRAMQQEAEATRAFQQKQAERRREIEKKTNEGIRGVHKKSQDKRNEILAQNTKRIDQLKEKFSREKDQTLGQQRKEYEHVKKSGQERLEYTRDKLQKNIARQQNESQKQLEDLENKTYQAKQIEIKERSEELEGIREDYRLKQKVAMESGTQKLEKVNEDFRKEIQRSHKLGDKQLFLQEQEQNRVLKKSQSEFEAEQKQIRDVHEKEKLEMAKVHLEQQEKMKSEHQKIIQNQNQNFKLTYEENAILNEKTLANQRELLTKSLNKEKKEVLETVGKYNTKNDDPFYRLKSTPSQFTESERAFVIETQIPEAEKDNIHVRVQKDKIVVNGQRRFEDKVEEGNQSLETNSYESFRQEFKLSHPVNEKAISSNYENGSLRVVVPKVGFLEPDAQDLDEPS